MSSYQITGIEPKQVLRLRKLAAVVSLTRRATLFVVLFALAQMASAAELFVSPKTLSTEAARGKALAGYLGEMHRGNLQDDLKLLNRYAPQPPAIQETFTAGRTAFGARADATFANCPEIAAACRQYGLMITGGPMLGALTADGASVWVRTVEPAEVTVLVSVDGTEKRFGPVRSKMETDLTAVVPVTGLRPGERYPYRLMVNNESISLPAAAITMPPAADKPGKFSIAFGSCFHKSGLHNPHLLAQIRERRNAALLLLGDIAVDDRKNQFGLHRSDYLLRDSSRPWRELVAAVPVYAAWDDHDYFCNDLAGIPREGYTVDDRKGAWQVWQQNWNNPSAGFGDERGGIFFRTRIGPCDVIMLDTRSLRTNKKEENSFLGQAQMHWLEQQLEDCRGPFIILSSGTMWSDYVSNGKDSWGVWDPQGREKIFSLIERKQIPGVLLVSGDRHGARVFTIPRPSGFAFHEFEPASLGGHIGPPALVPDCQQQLYGIAETAAFGEFAFDTTLPDPEVTFRLIRETGEELYSLNLKRSQLTPVNSSPGKLYETQVPASAKPLVARAWAQFSFPE